MFRVKISGALNFCCVYFLWVKLPTKICVPWKFDTTNNLHHKLGDMVAEHEKKLCVRGCHVHQDIYGKQQLQQHCSCTDATLLEREPLNSHGKYALLKCTDGTLEEGGT